MRKPAFCICENTGADQLHGKRAADQGLFLLQRSGAYMGNIKEYALVAGGAAGGNPHQSVRGKKPIIGVQVAKPRQKTVVNKHSRI